MAYPFPVTNQTMLEAVEKGLRAAGYNVEKLGRKSANITKGNQKLKIAIRTSRDRYIGSPQSGGALLRPDITALAIGAVDDVRNPSSVEVYLIPRTEILSRLDARRAAKRAANRAVGPGPTFIGLDKVEGTAGAGSGLAEAFKPIAEIKIGDQSADQVVSADDIEAVAGVGDVVSDGIDRFKQDVTESATKWLRFNPARVKIDIHITIDA